MALELGLLLSNISEIDHYSSRLHHHGAFGIRPYGDQDIIGKEWRVQRNLCRK